MPKLLGLQTTEMNKTLQGFDYTNVSIDKLGASEYTIVQIVVDQTGSVQPFKTDLENMLSMSLEACQKSPRALNLIARSTAFNADFGKKTVEEIHGFAPLSTIDTTKFAGTIKPDGGTPLYDATIEAIGALFVYGLKLYDMQILSNAIVFIVTDGDDNASDPKSTPAAIKDMIEKIRREEKIESIRVILIGINDQDAYMKGRLQAFKNDANLDEYVSVGEATKGKLAKLAQFVSRSTSSTSQALGTGGASAPISFTF
jgi:hypothetical protein